MHPSPVLFPPRFSGFSGRYGPWKLLGVRPGRWEGAGILEDRGGKGANTAQEIGDPRG